MSLLGTDPPAAVTLSLPVCPAQAAFCELAGTAAGYGYLKWLIADVSRYQPGDRIPMREAGALCGCMWQGGVGGLGRWLCCCCAAMCWSLLPTVPAVLAWSDVVHPSPVQAGSSINRTGTPEKLLSAGCPPSKRAAEKLEQPLSRNAAKLLAGFRQALQPRLLVLPGLVAAVAAWNSAFPEDQLGLVEQACLLGGFLSWKVRSGCAEGAGAGAGRRCVLVAAACSLCSCIRLPSSPTLSTPARPLHLSHLFAPWPPTCRRSPWPSRSTRI